METIQLGKLQLHNAIKAAVCQTFEVTWDDLAGAARWRHMNDARRVYCLLMVEEMGKTPEQVAAYLNRDASTVRHLRRTCDDYLQSDKWFRKKVEEAQTRLQLVKS